VDFNRSLENLEGAVYGMSLVAVLVQDFDQKLIHVGLVIAPRIGLRERVFWLIGPTYKSLL